MDIMACEKCGTVISYGKRKPSKHRLCIDCWKLAEKKESEKDENPTHNEQ